MFRVKICGVTTPADAGIVVAAGADAVGLNFVSGSPRHLDDAAARAVAAALPRGVLRVGVFAGATAAEILAVAARVGLDAIQCHGHLAPGPVGTERPWEPPSISAELAPLPVIRAVRLAGEGPAAAALAPALEWMAAAAAAGRAPAMLLVDAGATGGTAGGELGGTGRIVDWDRLARAGRPGVPLALAGGLTPGNVAAAIRATGVVAVDTASGVERAPGRKDPILVAAFVAAARRALDEPITSATGPGATPARG